MYVASDLKYVSSEVGVGRFKAKNWWRLQYQDYTYISLHPFLVGLLGENMIEHV